MALKLYIVRSANGTRLAGSHGEPKLMPGEVATEASPADLTEHNQRMATLLASAKAQAEPDEREVILEALKADLTPAKLAAARARLKAKLQGA